jgi:putative transferase (TIGR04331 family)
MECDSEKRDRLTAINIGDSEFEHCLSAMLPSDIPQCFVETYQAITRAVEENYPTQPNAIFSANCWYFDEYFKQWAAQSANNGTLLLGTQHGGCYGTLKNKLAEEHETAIVDYYYSWGWHCDDRAATVLPMPATNFSGAKAIGADNRKKGILFAGSTEPRYVIELPRLPVYLPEYFNRQRRFIRALSPAVLTEVRFRPHCEDHGWGVVERMRQCRANIEIESWIVPFLASLEQCRLYVCDHLSTTYAQSLALNKPTILFLYDHQTTLLSTESQPYFAMLRDAGILHDAPEAAASAVSEAYHDVETWWNAPQRQKAVELFCDRYARTAPNAITLWSDEFKKISRIRSYNK